jgi:hypothetical protein
LLSYEPRGFASCLVSKLRLTGEWLTSSTFWSFDGANEATAVRLSSAGQRRIGMAPVGEVLQGPVERPGLVDEARCGTRCYLPAPWHRGRRDVTELAVEFAGEERIVIDRLAFGRKADLDIDDNRHLHRQVGEFFADGGLWWLKNVGTRTHLIVIGSDGGRIELPPDSVVALTAPSGSVRFSAGSTRYELTFRQSNVRVPGARGELRLLGESTTQPGLVMTPREVDFAVTFARHRLLGVDAPTPTYAEVAELWGVSIKTLDNTLQTLKRKVKDAGLGRDLTLDAIVVVLVRQGFVTLDDLRWANLDTPSPRPAVTGPRFNES